MYYIILDQGYTTNAHDFTIIMQRVTILEVLRYCIGAIVYNQRN